MHKTAKNIFRVLGPMYLILGIHISLWACSEASYYKKLMLIVSCVKQLEAQNYEMMEQNLSNDLQAPEPICDEALMQYLIAKLPAHLQVKLNGAHQELPTLTDAQTVELIMIYASAYELPDLTALLQKAYVLDQKGKKRPAVYNALDRALKNPAHLQSELALCARKIGTHKNNAWRMAMHTMKLCTAWILIGSFAPEKSVLADILSTTAFLGSIYTTYKCIANIYKIRRHKKERALLLAISYGAEHPTQMRLKKLLTNV